MRSPAKAAGSQNRSNPSITSPTAQIGTRALSEHFTERSGYDAEPAITRGPPRYGGPRNREGVDGIKTLVAAVLTTAAVVATAFPATGAAVTEAGNPQAGASAKAGNLQVGAVAGAVGPQAGAFAHPSGTQHAIVDEALRNGAVPPELALAVARAAPDGRYAAGYATLPLVQGRFRSDNRPACGVARAGRFNGAR